MLNSPNSLRSSLRLPTVLRDRIREEQERRRTNAGQALGVDASRETCKSLVEFIKQAWPILRPTTDAEGGKIVETSYVHGWHIDVWCAHLEAITLGKFLERGLGNRLLGNVPPGTMKALDRDVPVLTTWGWKKHGDLQVGDFVFGPDGQPKRVTGCTVEAIEDSYEVVFDDGASIIASAGHLWEVERDEMSVKPRYSRGRKHIVVGTVELRCSGYKHGKSERRPDRIKVTEPVALPPKRLLVEPYVLGAWLGDGSSNSGIIYAAEK